MREKGITLSKVSQASPARPYDLYFSAEKFKSLETPALCSNLADKLQDTEFKLWRFEY